MDTEFPDKFGPALRIVAINLVWILPLIALERVADGHIRTAAVFGCLWLAVLAVAVKWSMFGRASTGPGRRKLAFALIAAAAILMSGGVYLLATSSNAKGSTALAAPPPPASVGYTETRIRLDREPGSDINFRSISANQKNIYTWQQVYQRVETRLLGTGDTTAHQSDSFFIIFDKPTTYQRPRIDSFGQKLPAYEFYLNSDRGVVLVFKDMLTISAFEIYFPPPEQK